jgi:prepilin signal peptidase PulO-like enzyme (type II secretory pathway)
MDPVELIELFVFISFLVPVIYNDIKTQKIPDRFVLPGIAVLLVAKILLYHTFSAWYIINPLAGFLFFWCIWFFSRGKMGLGDAKLSAYLALGLELPAWLLTVLLASLGGLLFAVFRLSRRKMSFKDKIPFAPFLACAAVIAYFINEPLLEYIKRLKILHL